MLVKINGILQSAAPADGESGGSAGGDPAAAGDGAPAGDEGSEGGSQDGGDGGLNETGEADDGDGFGEGFDLDEFLNYDPMKAAPTVKGEEEGEGEGDDPVTPTEGKKPAEPAKAKEEKEPGQKAKENPEMELLRNQVQQLTELLNRQQQQAQGAGDGQQGGGQQKPAEKSPQEQHQEILKSLPQYQFKVPQDVMQKFSSDDPATVQAGLSEYATGIAQVTHYNVLAQMRQEMAALREELLKESVDNFKQVSKRETQEQTQRSAISNDFYGKFPELDKPELKLFVQMQAKQLAGQYGVQGWNENFRDTLGAHVKKILGMSGQGPRPDGDPDPKKPGKSGQRFNSGSGAGRSKPSGKKDELADISDTLGI